MSSFWSMKIGGSKQDAKAPAKKSGNKSSFWTMKIGGSKQDVKEPAKKNNSKGKSYKKAPPDIVQSLMDRALTDAEQLVESIKTKARKEAEIEVARIVEQAKQIIAENGTSVADITETQAVAEPELWVTEETEVISTEPPTDETAESQTVPETEQVPVDESGDTAIISPTAETEESQTVTGAIVTEDTVDEEIIEPAIAETEEPQAETVAEEEPVTVTDESEEQPGSEEAEPVEIEADKNALYSEDVEIAIAVPVDPVAVSKLYNNLQMTPEIKILYTRGSWDKGTIITVSLEKPLPLLDIISSIPDVNVKVIEPQKKDNVKGTSSALLGVNKDELTRIDLQMKAR